VTPAASHVGGAIFKDQSQGTDVDYLEAAVMGSKPPWRSKVNWGQLEEPEFLSS
jgi:hypothetical protein